MARCPNCGEVALCDLRALVAEDPTKFDRPVRPRRHSADPRAAGEILEGTDEQGKPGSSTSTVSLARRMLSAYSSRQARVFERAMKYLPHGTTGVLVGAHRPEGQPGGAAEHPHETRMDTSAERHANGQSSSVY